MKSSLALAIVVAAGTASSVAAQAPTWQIDSAHSAAQFSVRHMMVSTVRGHFAKLSGSVQWDGKNVATAAIDVTVDAGSIETREEKRDAHLKSADFLDVANHPTMTFRSVSVAPGAAGQAKLTGDLTIRGVTKRVDFEIEGPTPVVNAGGTLRVGATATAVINRKDFGVSWSRVLDGGGLVVSDEVTLTIDIQAVRKAQ